MTISTIPHCPTTNMASRHHRVGERLMVLSYCNNALDSDNDNAFDNDETFAVDVLADDAEWEMEKLAAQTRAAHIDEGPPGLHTLPVTGNDHLSYAAQSTSAREDQLFMQAMLEASRADFMPVSIGH
jgi:hypothetical protein